LDIEIDDKKARQENLADILASKLDSYKMHKNKNDDFKALTAMILSEWIDKAYLNNFIKEAKALGRKLKECMEQKTELQNAVETLSERNLELEHEIVDLKARFEELNKVHKVFKEHNK
jgi:predicted  nucleic acid-binding Zn-ribbon protein